MATDPIRDFAADEDGEWIVTNGNFSAVGAQDAVAQGIRIRLRMFLGECYLDESVGVPYIDEILIKNADPLVVRADLQAAIASTPDVTNVVGAQLVEADDGSRSASIAFVADSV